MRKIIALVLTLTAIVVLFSACKKDGGGETSQNPVSSDTTTSAPSTTTTAPSTTGPTYILTTNQNKQAPWYSTTRFVAVAGVTSGTTQQGQSSPSNAYENITYPTSGAGSVTPSVSAVTSVARTTEWSTLPSSGSATTTTQAESTTKETTAAAKAEGMQVIINDFGFTDDGDFYAAIDKEGWGKIKSNSLRVPVYLDGVEADSPGTLQISSSTNADGNQYIYIDVSKYDAVTYGSEISFTVPEGFLKNSSGTRYNYAFYVSSNG